MSEIMFYGIYLQFDLFDVIKLQTHIKSYNNRLSNIIDGVVYDSGTHQLTVVFLTTPTQEDIDNIVLSISTYDNSPLEKRTMIINTGLQHTDVIDNAFRTIFQHHYQNQTGWIVKKWNVEAFGTANRTESPPSYTLRVVNVNTNSVLGLQTFNNQQTELCQINITGSIHHGDVLELQTKVNIGAGVTLTSAYMLFEEDYDV